MYVFSQFAPGNLQAQILIPPAGLSTPSLSSFILMVHSLLQQVAKEPPLYQASGLPTALNDTLPPPQH
jgi:hypothetical protein